MLWDMLRLIWKLPSKLDEFRSIKAAEIVISGEALARDYLSNGIAADNKYLHKIIEVSGKFYAVQSEFGDIALYLESGLLRCECSKTDRHNLEGLSSNDEVKVKGVVRGLHVGKVVLTGCRIKQE